METRRKPIKIGRKYKGDSKKKYKVRTLVAKTTLSKIFLVDSLNEEGTPRVLKYFNAGDRGEIYFEEEMEVLEGLKGNPNVVQITDRNMKQRFLVLEYVPGGSLNESLEGMGYGNVSLDYFATVMSQLSETLRDLHNKGVVHRDFKESNVLLSAEAKGVLKRNGNLEILVGPGAIKLCDFSFSLRDGTSRVYQTAKDNLVLGTPLYLPPETLRGQDGVGGEKTDVWSLGIVGELMISDRYKDLEAMGEKDYLTQIFRESIVPLKLNRDIGKDEEILRSMKEYFPENRPTMEEIAAHFKNRYQEIKAA